MAEIKEELKCADDVVNVYLKITEMFKKYGKVSLSASAQNAYSPRQRGALHVWCDMCAGTMKELGFPCYTPSLGLMQKILDHEFPITITKDDLIECEWTMTTFKDLVFKRTLGYLTGKTSTEDQSSVDPSEVARVITQAYASHGINLPNWPSRKG